MAIEIGFVKVLTGTATATAVDGTQRALNIGDRVYADELISTGSASAIEIQFADGTLMDLGRNTQALLDNEVFDPQQAIIESANEVDILALQETLIDGEDPTQQGNATAAGPENEGNDGGISTVIVEHISPITEITSGFETSAAVNNFLDDSNLFGEGISPLSLATQTTSPQNDITITIADTANVVEDSILTVDAAHGVLSNDSNSSGPLTINTFNVAGDSSTYTAGSTATMSGVGAFSLHSDGSYQFIPEANYNGPVPTTTYTTNTGASNTLALNVIPANDRPVVSDVSSQDITGEIVLNGVLTTSVDYWNFTHNGGDISIDMLTEISGPFNQNGTNGAGYNEINGDNTQTALDVMIRVYVLDPNGSRGAQVGVNDDNNTPGFDGSLYNRDSFLVLNNLPQGEYQLVVGAWNLTAAEVDSGINTVDAATWHFEGPYQITLNSDHGAQFKAKGIAFEATEGGTVFESSLPAVSDADTADTHDYFIVPASETLSQSNPLGAPIAMPIITVNTDGSYSVSGDFNSLAVGETATVTFQYIADDKHGFDGTDGINESSISIPATVTITIQGTNDSPIAFVDTATTTESLHITVDVLANDTDIDNGDNSSSFHIDNVSFLSGIPASSTATVSIVNNQLVFDPGTDFNYLNNGETASVIVNYTMSDDSGATSSSTATITVTGITNAPVITQALDDNTVSGTHDSAVSLKIFISDLAGNTISEHDAIVNTNGTWTADFTKPAVGDYKMTAVAYDGPNGTGNASDVSNVINVNVGSTYQNIVDSDDAINIVYDGAGSNTLSTGAGDDLFVVGRGNDTFNAGAGDDTFIVEGNNKGSNTFNGGAGNDTIQGGAGDDTIGLATFSAANSVEIIDGGAGNNVIQGATYANLDFSATSLLNISEIRGGNGSNTIIGSQGDDVIDGGRGNDSITGGTGNDILTGGTGNDLFIWNSADVGTLSTPSLDTVTDFSGSVVNPGARAQDVLDLSDLLSDGSHTIEGLAENNTGGGGQHLQLAIKDVATNTVVQTIDLNNVSVNVGDNTSDMLNNLLANGGINDGL
jgi:VCBS repeat-containing protein